MATPFPKPKPPPLPPSYTLTYKTVPSHPMDESDTIIPPIPIKADVFLPTTPPQENKLPVFLFIHGGGWIHSSREDYGRTWFKRFLALNYVVVSMDYRLLPESNFHEGQCQDVKDIEHWLRSDLQSQLAISGEKIEIDGNRVIVAGASAGAHLALLTPKLWTILPTAILSLYGPTNFHSIAFLNRGDRARERYPIPACTPSMLAHATTYHSPPTAFPVPQTPQDRETPRHWMGQHIYREEILAEFLLTGLVWEKRVVGQSVVKELRLPSKGSVDKVAIDKISPFHLAQNIKYPPVYQLVGTADWLFELEQMTEFEKVLTSQGVRNHAVVVKGGVHGFDIPCSLGDDVDVEFVMPAVEWLHSCL